MKDKKGDIAVTVLVIGVFVVCTLALVSFIISSNKMKTISVIGLDKMEELNIEIEKGIYNGRVINETKSGGWQPWNWSKEKTVFSVYYNP